MELRLKLMKLRQAKKIWKYIDVAYVGGKILAWNYWGSYIPHHRWMAAGARVRRHDLNMWAGQK